MFPVCYILLSAVVLHVFVLIRIFNGCLVRSCTLDMDSVGTCYDVLVIYVSRKDSRVR